MIKHWTLNIVQSITIKYFQSCLTCIEILSKWEGRDWIQLAKLCMSVLKNQSPFWSKPSLERSFSFVVIWYCTTISFSGVLLKKLFTWPLLWANNFRFKLWGLSWVILLFFNKKGLLFTMKHKQEFMYQFLPWYTSSSPTFEEDTIIITYSLMTHPG